MFKHFLQAQLETLAFTQTMMIQPSILRSTFLFFFLQSHMVARTTLQFVVHTPAKVGTVYLLSLELAIQEKDLQKVFFTTYVLNTLSTHTYDSS